MGLGRCLLVAGALTALFGAVVSQLDQSPKYEIVSRLIYPFFRLFWATGVAPFLLCARVDETDFTLPRPIANADWLAVVKGMEVSEDDLIIATFPKSGTHFAMQMALQISSEASELTAEFDTVHHFITVPEIIGKKEADALGDPKILHALNYRELSPIKPFVHGTHLDHVHVPQGAQARYVVMIRDPGDVLLSLQSMIEKILGRNAPSLEEMMPLMERLCGGWAAWHRSWWEHRDDPNVLILFYDDAVKDLPGAVSQVSKLMGKQGDEAVQARVVERTSFDYMKKRSRSFDPPFGLHVLPFQKPIASDIMTNKGKTGGGKTQLSQELQTMIRSHCQLGLKSTDFPMEKLPSCV